MLLLSLGEHQLVFTVEEDAKHTLTIREGIDEGHHNARASTADGHACMGMASPPAVDLGFSCSTRG